jgi:hypothetical protein
MATENKVTDIRNAVITELQTINGGDEFHYNVPDTNITSGVPDSLTDFSEGKIWVQVERRTPLPDDTTSGEPPGAAFSDLDLLIVGVIDDADPYTARERLEADILKALRSNSTLTSKATKGEDTSTEYDTSEYARRLSIATEGVCFISWTYTFFT